MINNNELIKDIVSLNPISWINDNKKKFNEIKGNLSLNFNDIKEAEERLNRFTPLIKKLFPETNEGIIESELSFANNFKTKLENYYDKKIDGKLLIKCDSHLKIAGSIKARGGIYEVLKFAEEIALSNNIITIDQDYTILCEDNAKNLFSKYSIVVGSTGNLGMSIGIMASSLGFKTIVHMSRDAKQWKKNKLRNAGVVVVEHNDDYSKAVEEGRKQCESDEMAYFIDDENSQNLFLGYSVAALRLRNQLIEKEINVNKDNPLNVYLPCGVGGAPGGIAFGLKHIYGDNVRCYFVEPVNAPCMLLGLITNKYEKVNVKDYGIKLSTEADGLAVGSPSKLVSKIANEIIDGIYTIEDNELLKLLVLIKDTENIKIEPSAASSLLGPIVLNNKGNHIAWLTGGLFLPDEIYKDMYNKGKLL